MAQANHRAAHTTVAGIVITVFVASIIILCWSNLAVQGSSAARDATGTLSKVSSGLTHYDPLNSSKGPNTSYWTFDGDAPEEGGTYSYNENSSGLYIGVASPAPNTWAGFYAASPDTPVLLFHTQLTLLYPSLPASSPSNYFDTGMYVQTSNGSINYVTCFGETSSSSPTYTWGLEYSTGSTEEATTFTTLWSQSYPISNTADLVQNCTIVTNGNNLLQLYMNGNLVYSSESANLQIPAPFNVYLEVETTSQTMLYGKYLDFYDTAGPTLSVENVPSGDTVEIVSGSGTVLASSTNTASSSATVSLPIAKYDLPLSASIKVLSGSTVLASTTSKTTIWGGDVYQFNGLSTTTSSTVTTTTSPSTTSTTTSTTSTTTTTMTTSTTTTVTSTSSSTSTLTVNSELTTGSSLTGMYTVLSQGSQTVSSGFTPIGFSVTNDETYSVTVDNYGNYYFDYWLASGSTNPTISITPSTSETLTAVYCTGSCPPPSTPLGDSVISVTTVNSTGTSISGYYIGLYQNGALINSCYSQCSFTVNNGQTYQVVAESYGSETFSYWQNNGATGPETVVVPSGSATISLTAVYSP